jgi:nitroreductase
MQLLEMVMKNRAYRRFDETRAISKQDILDILECARRVASGANLQPLRYHISYTEEENAAVFGTLKWAAYLEDWEGPEEGERPTAYITILRDTEVKNSTAFTDAGIALQTILLAAVEKGYGGCNLAAIDTEALRKIISVDDRYEIMFVTALGVPVEEVVLEELKPGGDIKYYRRGKVHYVPKRRLEDILL